LLWLALCERKCFDQCCPHSVKLVLLERAACIGEPRLHMSAWSPGISILSASALRWTRPGTHVAGGS